MASTKNFSCARALGFRPEVERVGDCSLAALGDPLLALVEVGAEVAALDWEEEAGGSFAAAVDAWAAAYVADQTIAPQVGSKCRRCPYRIGPALLAQGKASGFEACWSQAVGMTAQDSRSRPLVIDMARISSDALVAAGTLFLQDVEQAHIDPQPDDRLGMSASQRQCAADRQPAICGADHHPRARCPGRGDAELVLSAAHD